MKKETYLQSDDTVDILQTLGNPVRKAIVATLGSKYKALRFSELMEASGLDPNFDTGQFWYHISELMKRGIIIKNDDRYELSQFGFKLTKILDTLERECSFLLKERKEGGGQQVSNGYLVRKYVDTDFDDVAKLVKEMYHYYWVELLKGGEMSLEYARHTVATDLLVPGTYVYVAEDSKAKKLVGFVSYYVTHGGAFFLDYLWVKKKYLASRLREAFLNIVEEDVHKAGEDQYHVRFGARDKLFGTFFINQGFETLNQFEVTKYLNKVPERKYTVENVEILGYCFKRVI